MSHRMQLAYMSILKPELKRVLCYTWKHPKLEKRCLLYQVCYTMSSHFGYQLVRYSWKFRFIMNKNSFSPIYRLYKRLIMNYFAIDAFLVFEFLTDLLQVFWVILFLHHIMLGVSITEHDWFNWKLQKDNVSEKMWLKILWFGLENYSVRVASCWLLFSQSM